MGLLSVAAMVGLVMYSCAAIYSVLTDGQAWSE